MNDCSIAKPHTVVHLQARLISYALDSAIMVETNLKTHHRESIPERVQTPEGDAKGHLLHLDFGNSLLYYVLIILLFNNKWP